MILNINYDYLNKFEIEIDFIIKLTEFTFNTVKTKQTTNTTNYKTNTTNTTKLNGP